MFFHSLSECHCFSYVHFQTFFALDDVYEIFGFTCKTFHDGEFEVEIAFLQSIMWQVPHCDL